MTDNIVPMPTAMNVLADRIRAAIIRAEQSHIEWIEATLELAATLKEARDRFPSNMEFAVWLAENELDILGHQDRSALINMAADLALARIVLQETNRKSWRLIWDEEMKGRLTSVGKMPPIAASPQKSPEPAAIVHEKEQAAIPEPTKLPVEITERQRRASPLGKLPNVDCVLTHVQSSKTRALLATLMNKRGTRPLWNLLVTCIQNGTFGGPATSHVEDPTLRLVFPWMPANKFVRSFNLIKTGDLETTRDFIIPYLLHHPDRSPAIVDELAVALRRRAIEQEEERRNLIQMKQHRERVASLPQTEQEIIAYGVPLWPSDRYSYEEIKHACWFTSYMIDLLQADTPLSKRMNLLHAMKFIDPIIAPGLMRAIGDVADAYYNNPNSTEYKWPPKPRDFFTR